MPRVIAFDNTFLRELPDAAARVDPAPVAMPGLLFLNEALADQLGMQLPPEEAALSALFSGNELPMGAEPVAQVYAGHQFGQFAPQLGDGRALLLGEVIDRCGQRRDIVLKGSGRTPYSRNGDGKATAGSMLREALLGEAMHALGIPTTRALAVVSTGEAVWREGPLPGAVLTRVAASHLRIGTFEYFAARGDVAMLRRLADYAVDRHDPALRFAEEKFPAFLQAVAHRQAILVAQWMNAGFIHGVMNTDNMLISGETIDYGPCAFLEHYDPRAAFSAIDTRGRYCYGNQPAMMQWNLARFAECLLPLLDADHQIAVEKASAVIHAFPDGFRAALLDGQCTKLGLFQSREGDAVLVDDWLSLLEENRADFTQAHRFLVDAAQGNDLPLQQLIADGSALVAWLARWRTRCAQEDGVSDAGNDVLASPGDQAVRQAARVAALRATNPRIIARNHRVEEALDAAVQANDMVPFMRLLAALRTPFSDDPALARYAEPASAEVAAGYRTFCGT